MNTIKTVTIDDLRRLPPLSDADIKLLEIEDDSYDDECPFQSPSELSEYRSWREFGRKSVVVDIDADTMTYFEELSKDTGLSYRNLMNLYLGQCAREKKKPIFV